VGLSLAALQALGQLQQEQKLRPRCRHLLILRRQRLLLLRQEHCPSGPSAEVRDGQAQGRVLRVLRAHILTRTIRSVCREQVVREEVISQEEWGLYLGSYTCV
jgi:hypothetical protein